MGLSVLGEIRVWWNTVLHVVVLTYGKPRFTHIELMLPMFAVLVWSFHERLAWCRGRRC